MGTSPIKAHGVSSPQKANESIPNPTTTLNTRSIKPSLIGIAAPFFLSWPLGPAVEKMGLHHRCRAEMNSEEFEFRNCDSSSFLIVILSQAEGREWLGNREAPESIIFLSKHFGSEIQAKRQNVMNLEFRQLNSKGGSDSQLTHHRNFSAPRVNDSPGCGKT